MGQLLLNSNDNIVGVRVLMSLLFIGLLWVLVHVYNMYNVWLKSKRLRMKLRMQGIGGPTPSFWYGNFSEMQKIKLRAAKSSSITDQSDGEGSEFVAHDYTSTVFPYFEQWRKEYGSLYTYSIGTKQHLYINRPELVKEMNHSITLDLGKPTDVSKRLAPMLGNSILRSNGASWAHQRKLIAPEFFMDKVKGMVGLMMESAEAMVRNWEECIEANGGIEVEIEVDEDLRGLSANVIAKACFGSSFTKGKEVFTKLRSLQTIISTQGFLHGSTTNNLGIFGGKKKNEVKRYEKEIESLIWKTIVEREHEKDESERKDLLQLILEAVSNDQKMDKEACKHFIVDNCKSMYFAGHESTAVAASWCLMLLALHPKWQDNIRAEIAQICPNAVPDANTVPHLKTVTMVVQEVLRLYPPAAFVSREALKETKIGSITVPKGVSIWTLIPTLHRDPEVWGPDANEFKPERFTNGVAKAQAHGTHQAYFPFGIGPRLCLAKNFAMAELKVVIALVVSKFVFSLSPNYRHCPAYKMIVEPGLGVQIIVNKI